MNRHSRESGNPGRRVPSPVATGEGEGGGHLLYSHVGGA